MVTIEEIQIVYYMMAATGVLVAAAYYIYNMRINQRTMKTTLETRQADILQRHAQVMSSQDFMDAWHDVVFNQSFLTYEEWLRDYGPTVNPDAYTHLTALVQYHETLGGLLRENLVSIELVEKMWQPLHIIYVWDRVEPIIKGWRKRYHEDSLYENFEYLFNRFMERQPDAVLTRKIRHDQMVQEQEEITRSKPS